MLTIIKGPNTLRWNTLHQIFTSLMSTRILLKIGFCGVKSPKFHFDKDIRVCENSNYNSIQICFSYIWYYAEKCDK